ncbi:TPM domain-containing protein [Leptonema illini]|uniref:TPM domain-containing protein n=1 Tax=Leptonema illini TaxID=183 RepID=UPI001B7FBA9F|nr:TPM domain-containing protein [Leptonema illini]
MKTVPNPKTADNTWVSDPANKLSGEDRQRINALINSVEDGTTAEIAVVILPSIGEQVPKEFAVELFNTWGIGKKGKDNGLLLLIVLDQRRWEFETGYGLEGDLPDATLKRIGENKLVPGLRANRMGDGIYDALVAVADKLGAAQLTGEDTPTQHTTPGGVGGDVSDGGSADSYEDSYAESDVDNSPFYRTYEYRHNIMGLDTGEQMMMTVLAGFYAVLVGVVTVLVFRSARKKDAKASGWKYARYAAYWLIPGILFLSFVYFEKPDWLAYVYYPIGALWAGIQRIFKNRNLLAGGGEPYEIYKRFRADHGGLFYTSIVLFPFPMALLALFFGYKLKALRNEPRPCPHCSSELTRLDEKGDDLFLDEGQRKEEQLGSVDYDVWHCSKCDHVKVFPYDAFLTSYNACPSCSYKTYHTVGDRTLVSPTCSSSGKGERDYKCEHCGHSRTESYTIPKRDCSKSSSSSGGSSYRSSGGGGGGSFGGGRSGGGGAGGGW